MEPRAILPGSKALTRVAVTLLLALAVVSTAACAPARDSKRTSDGPREAEAVAKDRLRGVLPDPQIAFLDSLEQSAFRWFWEQTDSTTGLTPDRAPTPSFVSVGAMGFALTAYPIGAERGWVTRAQAAERARRTLAFMASASQDTANHSATGAHGFFYHFLDMKTGRRYRDSELSTIDTALLLAGARFCRAYFDGSSDAERGVRAWTDTLLDRVEWGWVEPRPPSMALGWSPEAGFLPYDWGGLNETIILHILAIGSDTHPVTPGLWSAYTRHYRWGTFEGFEQLGFAPLFGHQYSHIWIDFRGIRDDAMRAHDLDYFENSRRATLSQRAYAIENPAGFRGYGERLWGLTACDGPIDTNVVWGGRGRQFHSYSARGATFTHVNDDGTICPAAAAGSMPFAPKECADVLMAMRADWGTWAMNRYGFVDAFNPTLNSRFPVRYGRIVPNAGWFDVDQLGIDQGPILAMIENARSELIWRTMRRDPQLVRGLRRAGFRGGWLDAAPAEWK